MCTLITERAFFLKPHTPFIEYICTLVILVDFYLIYFEGWVECMLLRWKKICIHFNLSYGVTYTDNWSYVPVCPLKLDQLLMIDVLNLFQRVAWGTKWCMAWIGSLGINWGRRPVASKSQCLPTDARRGRDLAVIHIHTQETRTPRSSQQKLPKDCHV